VRDAATGGARALTVWLISAAIAIPVGSIVVIVTVWLLVAYGSGAAVMLVIALLWLGLFAIAAVLFVGAIRRRASKLDAVFTPLGLEGGPYQSFFRQYHGAAYGRQVDVYLRRGPVLEIAVATSLNTRLGVTERQSDTSFFADLAGRRPLPLADPQLAALSVFALDEGWAAALLAESTASDALRRLTALGATVFTRQNVLLRPGTLTLMLSGNRRLFGLELTSEQARLWVDDLVRVVQAAEALPAPRLTAEPSAAEQYALRTRGQNPHLALWVGLAILGFFVVLSIVVFVGVFLFANLGAY
jgi:hypothetical protein